MSNDIDVVQARKNYAFSTSLSGILRSGETGLTELPGSIKRAIEKRVWESLYVFSTNRMISFPSMKAWIEAMHPEGLGASVELVRSLIKDDAEAMGLFIQETEALQNNGGDRKSNAFQSNNINLKNIQDDNITLSKNSADNITCGEKPKRQAGTSQSYLLARISRDRPDLLGEIGKGKRFPSARAAAKEAGIPVATQITVSKKPETTALVLMTHYQKDEQAEFVGAAIDLLLANPESNQVQLIKSIEDRIQEHQKQKMEALQKRLQESEAAFIPVSVEIVTPTCMQPDSQVSPEELNRRLKGFKKFTIPTINDRVRVMSNMLDSWKKEELWKHFADSWEEFCRDWLECSPEWIEWVSDGATIVKDV